MCTNQKFRAKDVIELKGAKTKWQGPPRRCGEALFLALAIWASLGYPCPRCVISHSLIRGYLEAN